MTISPARRSAFEILRRVETESAFASVLLTGLDPAMRADDRALCHELVLGVLRRRLWLDRIIDHFGERKVEKLDLPVRLALELGLYQLRFLTRIPHSAAVNESVNLVRSGREKSAAGFVNALLRRATRDPDYDPAGAISDPVEKLSLETSHPYWLLERWVQAFGFAEAGDFARANNEAPPTAFRLTSKASRDEAGPARLLSELRTAGAEITPSDIAPNSWRISGATTVLRKFVNDGLVYLQDEASQLVAHLLQVEPGQRVLDVTAAPGSKATHIAALAPSATIFAGDLHPHRAETMRRLAERQGARINILVHDATGRLAFPDESFDRVLLDAPCSGTGTLRGNPEIRYRLRPEDITELAAQQKLMLERAAAVVGPAGLLVYSTCSVEPEENEQVVNSFALTNTNFTRVNPGDVVSSFILHPSSLLSDPLSLLSDPSSLRLWPHREGCDGFFISCFQRRP